MRNYKKWKNSLSTTWNANFESIFHRWKNLLINFLFFLVTQQRWQSTISFHFNNCFQCEYFFYLHISSCRMLDKYWILWMHWRLQFISWEEIAFFLLCSCVSVCVSHFCQGLVLSTRLTVTVISKMVAKDIYCCIGRLVLLTYIFVFDFTPHSRREHSTKVNASPYGSSFFSSDIVKRVSECSKTKSQVSFLPLVKTKTKSNLME